MITSQDREMALLEKKFAEEQSALNRAHELEMKRLELSFGQWLRIPLELIQLPVKLALILPLSIAVARKQVPEKLWGLFK